MVFLFFFFLAGIAWEKSRRLRKNKKKLSGRNLLPFFLIMVKLNKPYVFEGVFGL